MHNSKSVEKYCPKCSTSKSITDFGRDSSRIDGRYTYCKECRRRPPSAAEAELLRLAKKNQKRCTKCNKIKPFSAYDKDSTKRLGLASSCKKCHADRKRNRAKEWHSRQEELDRLFLEGKSRCTKCGSIKRLHMFLKSKRTKLGIYRLCKDCNNEYRTRRRPSNRDYTNWEVFEDDEFTCYLCEEVLDPTLRHPNPKSLSIDHVIPLSLGGSDSRENVRTTCLECNLDKRARPLEVYLELKGAS